MLVRRRKPWELPARALTPERAYLNRRQFLAGLGATGAAGLLGGCYLSVEPNPSAVGLEKPIGFLTDLYPAARNFKYAVDRALTGEYQATHFNNFYEFTTSKSNVWRLTDDFVTNPWTVEVGGLVHNPKVYDLEPLIRSIGLEERHYRFRCVEAWSMTVPWTGFSLSRLLELAQPLSSAKFVRFVTASAPEQMPGLASSQGRLPWPYNEGLRLDEAMNELSFLVTGIYGRPLPPQNGAPLRLAVPWKYGYKSIKSIVKIELVEQQPATFWNTINASEYDFWSNVNPEVPHPRWSQATEQPIEGGPRIATVLYNGYGEQVASLYG